MKKVAFFLTSFEVGGMERILINYANELSLEYDTSIISCNEFGELKSEVSENVKIEIIGNKRLRACFFTLRAILKIRKYEIVITGGNSLNCLLTLVSRTLWNRPKVIISQHCYPNLEQAQGVGALIDRIAVRCLYPLADHIFAVSKGISDYLVGDMNLSPSKISVIYNGINIAKVQSKSMDGVCGILPDKYVVFVGRMSVVKNVPLLLRSFDKVNIKGLHLVLLGDGDQISYLQNIAKEMVKKDIIHFMGTISNPYPYIRKAQALLLSSSSEAFPLVVIEALSLNTPVVTTPTKGPVEILEGTNGGIITNSFNDEDEYANAIERIVKNSNRNLNEICEKYSMKESVRCLNLLINS